MAPRFEWDAPCIPLCCDTLDRFAKGFAGCLQKAYDMGFNVLIKPHLDEVSCWGSAHAPRA